MTRAIKYGIVFLGAGTYCLLLGISLDHSSDKKENIKYTILFAGLSIISLYLGLSWKKPSYGGGLVHKYGAICFGILSGPYSIYHLVKLL